jgi:hypothetical protein
MKKTWRSLKFKRKIQQAKKFWVKQFIQFIQDVITKILEELLKKLCYAFLR